MNCSNKIHRLMARSKDIKKSIRASKKRKEDIQSIIKKQVDYFINSFESQVDVSTISKSYMERLNIIRSQMKLYMFIKDVRLYDENNFVFYGPFCERFTILLDRYEDITNKIRMNPSIAEETFNSIFQIPEEEEEHVSVREYSYDPSVYLENDTYKNDKNYVPRKKNKPFKMNRDKNFNNKLLTNFNLYSPEANLIFELTDEQKLTDYDSIKQMEKQMEEDEMNRRQWDDICTSNVMDMGPCHCCGGFVRD